MDVFAGVKSVFWGGTLDKLLEQCGFANATWSINGKSLVWFYELVKQALNS
jgi:hypothetical protein